MYGAPGLTRGPSSLEGAVVRIPVLLLALSWATPAMAQVPLHLSAGAIEPQLRAALEEELPDVVITGQPELAELLVELYEQSGFLELTIRQHSGRVVAERSISLADGWDPGMRVVLFLITRAAREPPAPEVVPPLPPPAAPPRVVSSLPSGLVLGVGVAAAWWWRPATPQFGPTLHGATRFGPLRLGGRVTVLGVPFADRSTKEEIDADVRSFGLGAEARLDLVPLGRLTLSVFGALGSDFLVGKANAYFPDAGDSRGTEITIRFVHGTVEVGGEGRFSLGRTEIFLQVVALNRLPGRRIEVPGGLDGSDAPLNTGVVVLVVRLGVNVWVF